MLVQSTVFGRAILQREPSIAPLLNARATAAFAVMAPDDAATYLAERGATLVGIDSLNVDSIDDNRRPVHSTLLRKHIPIVEHLRNLAEVQHRARFFAAPVAVKGIGTFPVRAFAINAA